MKKSFETFLLLWVLTAVGCSSSTSPTDPLVAGLNTVVWTSVTPQGDSSYTRIIAQFYQNDGKTLRPVDSVVVNHLSPAYSALNKYYLLDTTKIANDTGFDWHVVASSGLSSFDQHVSSPATLRISSPHPLDTISRSAGFTVSWGPAVSGGSVNVAIDDGSVSPPTIQGIADNGSVTIAGSQISASKLGNVTLYVYRETTFSQVFSSKIYQFDCQSQSRVAIYLKP